MVFAKKDSFGRGSKTFVFLSRPLKAFLSRSFLIILIILSLLLLFVIKIDSPFTRSVKLTVTDIYSDVASYVATPFELLYRFRAQTEHYFFVFSENLALKEENRALKSRLSSLTNMESENKQLKSLLNFVESVPPIKMTTRLVGFGGGPFSRTVLIDAGTSHGVQNGQALVAQDGLVGRVIEAGDRSARILLITDIESRIPVISNETRQRSIMAGRNTTDPELLYLPKDTRIREGEELFTSGDGDMFASTIPVGVVYKTETNHFAVRPYVNMSYLDHLSVLTLPSQKED